MSILRSSITCRPANPPKRARASRRSTRNENRTGRNKIRLNVRDRRRSALILCAPESEHREENERQKKHADRKPGALAKTFRYVNADDEVENRKANKHE